MDEPAMAQLREQKRPRSNLNEVAHMAQLRHEGQTDSSFAPRGSCIRLTESLLRKTQSGFSNEPPA